jgi:hypothetical protein
LQDGGVALETAGPGTAYLNNAGTYTTPAGGGNVVGVSPTVVGNVALWDNTTGDQISDAGVALQTAGGANLFLNAQGDYLEPAGGGGGIAGGALNFSVLSDSDVVSVGGEVILAWDATNRQFIFKRDPSSGATVLAALKGHHFINQNEFQVVTASSPLLTVDSTGIYLSQDGTLDTGLNMTLNGDGTGNFVIGYVVDAVPKCLILSGGAVLGANYLGIYMTSESSTASTGIEAIRVDVPISVGLEIEVINLFVDIDVQSTLYFDTVTGNFRIENQGTVTLEANFNLTLLEDGSPIVIGTPTGEPDDDLSVGIGLTDVYVTPDGNPDTNVAVITDNTSALLSFFISEVGNLDSGRIVDLKITKSREGRLIDGTARSTDLTP